MTEEKDETTTDVEPAEAAEDAAVEPTEEAAAPAAPTAEEDTTVADASALFIGVSRPQDEYGASVTDRDAMSDDELLAMGVEPDNGPNNTLVGTFAGLTIAVGTTAIFVAMFFLNYVHKVEAAHFGDEDRILVETREDAAAVLGAYAEVTDEEGGTTGYRVPVEVGMDLLVEDAALLRMHPMGDAPEPLVPDPPAPTPVQIQPAGAGNELQLQLQNSIQQGGGIPTGHAGDTPGHEGHGH